MLNIDDYRVPEGCDVLNRVAALTQRLYGHTHGRARYRIRLRRDLFVQMTTFIAHNSRVIDYFDLRAVVVRDKALILPRPLSKD